MITQLTCKKLSKLTLTGAIVASLSACGTTTFPASKGGEKSTGHNFTKAKILGADKRVIYSNGKDICAEASPDALLARSASAGLGASIPTQGAGSGSAAAQESAASIGLRTQSISLQREILYRLCEANYSDSISQPQYAALLGRSQDLTTVILAVEQLTGAVVANQVGISNISGARSSASLVSNHSQLETARQLETDAKAEVDRQSELKKEAVDDKIRAEQALKVLKDREQQLELAGATSAEKAKNQTAISEAETNLKIAEMDVATAEENLKFAKQNHADAKKLLATSINQFNSAITNASATAGGDVTFNSGASGGLSVNDTSVQHIAEAVESMVNNVVNKSQKEDFCLHIFSTNYRLKEAVKDTDPNQYANTINNLDLAAKFCSGTEMSSDAKNAAFVSFSNVTESLIEANEIIEQLSRQAPK